MRPEAGILVDGRYRLIERIGKGGMAEVWAAHDERGSRQVALKFPHGQADPGSELARRLQREASLIDSIQSKHVCALLGSGSWNGAAYLVFERLHGEPLDKLLEREPCLAFGDVAEIVSGILQGLVDAHRAGVIHRDLTPHNVFLEQQGEARVVRILDFGISRRTESESVLTAKGGTLGTCAFMAPEQAVNAHDVDERADVYAVGVIAFRCLAGRLPFQSGDAYVVISHKMQMEPPTLAEVTSAPWPSDLERFLQTALARSRDQRFPSAFGALNAWRTVIAGNQNAGIRRRESADEPRDDTQTLTLARKPPARS